MAEDDKGGTGTETAPPPPNPQGGQGGNDGGETPPWGENFDPKRAWSTIQNLRRFEEESKELRKQNQKLADEKLSEQERVAAERDREKARADGLEMRLMIHEVAAEKNLPAKYASRLQGSTKAELEADADKMIEDFDLDVGDSGNGSGRQRETGFDAGARGGSSRRPATMDQFIRTAGRR